MRSQPDMSPNQSAGTCPSLRRILRCGAWTVLVVLWLGGFSPPASALTVTRGPYLQIGTPTSIVVRWRTDSATSSVVSYGTSVGNRNQSVTVSDSVTDHVVTLTNLDPATRYYYAVGNTGGSLAGAGDASYSFLTAPTAGTVMPVRIWALGDSGGGTAAWSYAEEVRDAYMANPGAQNTNLWLMLGDNAYPYGTDTDYKYGLFNIFPVMLRRAVLWPTLGNHDLPDSPSYPYYDIFSLPMYGEAGGVASGTEEYYSFDYANIHFICLNSFNVNRSPGSPMLNWLQTDIAATDKQWVIAFFHHPPYSMGTHNSDWEIESIEMRENVLPILESYGVDLVMTGHSHIYERSYLLNGHYGYSWDFNASTMKLDGGDGREDGTGAYTKPNVSGLPSEGAVYVVSGNASYGWDENPYWLTMGTHPANLVSLQVSGSMILDVNGGRMDVKLLNSLGVIQDYFTITKEPDTNPPVLQGTVAKGSNVVSVDFSEALEVTSAQTASNYVIGNGITVTGATLDGNGHTVTLNVTPLKPYVTYTLTVNGVKDLANNPVASGSQAQFSYDPVVTVGLQDGVAPTSAYAGTRDSYINESSQSANTNFGTADTLFVDGQSRDRSALLRWNLAAIPADAIVQSTTLTLNVTDPSTDSYELYELLRDWQELTVTWNSPWLLPGAFGTSDRGTVQLASIVGSATGSMNVPLGANGIAVIQSWVDGSKPNNGFLLADTTPSNALGFYSRESTTAANRPRLTIVYTTDTDLDGLPNGLEATLGTNPDLPDTDGDGVSDYDEVGRDGNPSNYTPGSDTDPLNPDTDGDRLTDGVEITHGSNPLNPASYPVLADGDLAPLGNPDGNINAADYLISLRITLGLLTPTALELAHGDLYPVGGNHAINLSDTLLQQQLLFSAP